MGGMRKGSVKGMLKTWVCEEGEAGLGRQVGA